jgi:Zn finger protein HypA/HybF involved in hydrogenase expression
LKRGNKKAGIKRSTSNLRCPSCKSRKARRDWVDPKRVFCPECGETYDIYKGMSNEQG